MRTKSMLSDITLYIETVIHRVVIRTRIELIKRMAAHRKKIRVIRAIRVQKKNRVQK